KDSAPSKLRFLRIVAVRNWRRYGSCSSSDHASARMAVQIGSLFGEPGFAADIRIPSILKTPASVRWHALTEVTKEGRGARLWLFILIEDEQSPSRSVLSLSRPRSPVD